MAETKRQPRESIARWCGFLAGHYPAPTHRAHGRDFAARERPKGSDFSRVCAVTLWIAWAIGALLAWVRPRMVRETPCAAVC